MTRVLLLTAHFGDGHRLVAQALRESFERRGVRVEEIDCFRLTNRWMADVSQFIYEWSTESLPALYGLMHRATASLPTNSLIWRASAVFSRSALMKSVAEFQPDIVLQLFPDHAPTTLHQLPHRPFVGVVITDFSVHSRWFHPGVDMYFIPHEGLLSSMRRFVEDGVSVMDSGIPIRKDFQDAWRMPRIRSMYHPYIVISTGGRGVFPQLEWVTATVLDKLKQFHVFVLCGRNEEMLGAIQKMSNDHQRLHGLGYVDDVARWYRDATFTVMKAGGVSISECLACGCPMVFYKPQPGQEMDNACYLENTGAGIRVETEQALDGLLSSPDFMERVNTMHSIAGGLGRPYATDKIVNTVLEQAKWMRDIQKSER